MFWDYHSLDRIHIELTNSCNAACPNCVRFYCNSTLVRPDLSFAQITFEKFKEYFPIDIIKKCKIILFCGVHGDPVAARDLLQIAEYIAETSDTVTVGVNTNGGSRNSAWWAQLGHLFASKKAQNWYVTFSVDGLKDTNHLYRRNVVWDNLMNNITAFIKQGAYANWDFLIFKHNEHQVEEALALSKNLGFLKFIPKKSFGLDDGEGLMLLPARNAKGEVDYWIEAPETQENRNLEFPTKETYKPAEKINLKQYHKQRKNKADGDHQYAEMVSNFYRDRFSKVDHKGDSCQIKCKSKTENSQEIFIDCFGRVFPCCFVGTQLNSKLKEESVLQLHHHMEEYGWKYFDLNQNSLEEILKAGHLDRVYADTWDLSSTLEGRLQYCSQTCGKPSQIERLLTHNLITKHSNND